MATRCARLLPGGRQVRWTLPLAVLALVLSAAGTAARRPTPAQATGTPVVTLFADVNFSGTALTLTPGTPHLDDFTQLQPAFNDKASSLVVSPGATIAVFSDIYGEGRCQQFSASATTYRIASLVGTWIGNDTISSLYFGPCPLTLCRDANYQGGCATFGSVANLADYGWNDVASSLKVADNFVVWVYRDAGWSGACDQSLPGDWVSWLGNWVPGNDAISSVLVLGPASPNYYAACFAFPNFASGGMVGGWPGW